MAIISGPGGLAVSAAEACGNEGLTLAQLSHQTTSTLAKFIPPTGTSLHNPIDVGLTASIDIEIYAKATRTVVADPGVDSVVVVGIGLSPETNQRYTESMIQAHQDLQKPIFMVNIPGFDAGACHEDLRAGPTISALAPGKGGGVLWMMKP
jgi:acyl-CoA synthetase (NDP forming)